MSGFDVALAHVQISAPTSCEVYARKFYGGLLGLPEIDKPKALSPKGGCWFQIGAQQIHIRSVNGFLPSLKVYPAFSVSDIAGLFEHLRENRITVEWDTTVPTIKRFFAKDPWGNRLEFVQKGS